MYDHWKKTDLTSK